MILDKMGLPIVHLFSSGSLIPPKVQFWGSDDCKTSKLKLYFLPYKDNHHKETKLYLYVFVSVKCEVLVVECIAELVADTASGADNLVNIAMGMTVNPVVDAAGCNIVSKFDGEGSVDVTFQKLR